MAISNKGVWKLVNKELKKSELVNKQVLLKYHILINKPANMVINTVKYGNHINSEP